MSAPSCSSLSVRVFLKSLTNSDRCRKTAPPPGTMPSSTAAKVAFLASSMRSLRSSSSVSVAAPTCTHAAQLRMTQPAHDLTGADSHCTVSAVAMLEFPHHLPGTFLAIQIAAIGMLLMICCCPGWPMAAIQKKVPRRGQTGDRTHTAARTTAMLPMEVCSAQAAVK